MHGDKPQIKIRSCGIGFEIWEKTNADGKGSATFDLTSLLGNDKKLLTGPTFKSLASHNLRNSYSNMGTI